MDSCCPNCKVQLTTTSDGKLKIVEPPEGYPRIRYMCMINQDEHSSEFHGNYYKRYIISNEAEEKEWHKLLTKLKTKLDKILGDIYDSNSWAMGEFDLVNLPDSEEPDNTIRFPELVKFLKCLETKGKCIENWTFYDFSFICNCSNNIK